MLMLLPATATAALNTYKDDYSCRVLIIHNRPSTQRCYSLFVANKLSISLANVQNAAAAAKTKMN